jgi:hypothetical protein
MDSITPNSQRSTAIRPPVWHRIPLVGVLVVLLVMSVVEAVFLGVQNRRLANNYEKLRAATLEELAVRPGEPVIAITGFDTSGKRLSVRTDGSTPSLVFAYSAGCAACQENRTAYERLASAAQKLGVQVLFVSRDYVATVLGGPMAGLPGILIAEPTYRTHRNLGLYRVPQTILVVRGNVVQSEIGILDVQKERRLLDALRAASGRPIP